MSKYQPRSWRDLRILGRVLAGDSIDTNGDSDYDEDVSKIKEFVEKLQKDSSEGWHDIVETISTRPLGFLGRLALCKLDWLCTPPAVLMAAVHVLFLRISHEDFDVVLKCTGCDEDDQEWPTDEKWPELFPDGWLADDKQKSFSLRYELVQVSNCEDSKSFDRLHRVNFLVKGVMMGSNMLLVSGVATSKDTHNSFGSDQPVSCGLPIGDFVAAIEKPYNFYASLSKEKKENLGLCGLITRASALQLSMSVRRQLVDPLVPKCVTIKPKKKSLSLSAAQSKQQRVGIGGGMAYFPVGPNANVGNEYDIRGPAAGFGNSDLYPSFSGTFGAGGIGGDNGSGGMLFSPGNPAFDRWFRGDVVSRTPETVPPGARFDPYGPPGIGGMHPRSAFRPGNSNEQGSYIGGTGEPEPDHLVPPGLGDVFM